MSTSEELKEPTFGPIVTDGVTGPTDSEAGRKGGEAAGVSADSEGDVSSPEEENESRIPGDPRDINEQQPPTSLEF